VASLSSQGFPRAGKHLGLAAIPLGLLYFPLAVLIDDVVQVEHGREAESQQHDQKVRVEAGAELEGAMRLLRSPL